MFNVSSNQVLENYVYIWLLHNFLLLFNIELCAQHNNSKEKIIKDCELKTDFLKRHLKTIEEERTTQVQELFRSNEMRVREIVR